MDKLQKSPIIVLGAARSGTKMLRNTIASHPDITAVPHDVNFIWKYDNYGIPHDELKVENLTASSKSFIRKFFLDHSRKNGNLQVIEKTVSNTIRVDFVKEVFPACYFVHLVRDGRDVTASSYKQWQMPMDSSRVKDKIKMFPIAGLPIYARNYVFSYIKRLLSTSKQVASWGVELEDLRELLKDLSLMEVCGLQWSRCVEHTYEALADFPKHKQIEVRYEDFVSNPHQECERVLEFLGRDMNEEVTDYIDNNIRTSSISKWKKDISEEELDKLMPHIEKAMKLTKYL